MKNLSFLAVFFALTLFLNCGSDDGGDDFYFEAVIDGEAYRTETIRGASFFTIHTLNIPYDDSEINLQIDGLDVGTYEALASENYLEGNYNARSVVNGSLEVTSYNSDSKIMEGTVNVTFRGGLPGLEDVVIQDGRFRVKFFL